MSWSGWLNSLATRVLARESPELKSPSSCPIQRLPNELLIIIFRHAISSSSPPKCASFSPHVQTLLSQVSKQWDSVISSTPSLWRHVPILPRQPTHVLRTFLRNSSSLPISVTVHPWSVVPTHTATRSLDMQLRTLLETRRDCERIISLRIEATGLDDLVDRVLRTWTEVCGDWQMLSLKSVYLKGESHTVWEGSRFFDGAVAPVLRTLVVEDMPLGWFQGSYQCSSSLSTLIYKHSPGFGGVSTLELAQLVSAFPSVTTAQLIGPVVDLETQQYLESRFGASASGKLSSPLHPLNVDGVTSLHITGESKMPMSPMDPFHFFRSITGTHDPIMAAIPTATPLGSSTPWRELARVESVDCEGIYVG